ncbi:methyl-accepting chemotaxis protein [Maricaulis sp. CAU 1757]
MTGLDQIRTKAQGALTLVLVGMTLIYPLAGWFVAPQRILPGLVISIIAVAIAATSWKLTPNTPTSRVSTGVAVIIGPALFVYLFSGSAWQIDMHMMFFGALAMTAILLDWRVIVAASAVTAIHHLSLNFLLPWAVFPDGANFARVLFHAVVVIGQSSALVWMTFQAAKALVAAESGSIKAMEAQEAAAASQLAQSNTLASAEESRQSIAQLAVEFESALRLVSSGISGAAQQVDQLASQLNEDAEATRSGAETAAGRAQQTNGDVQSVAAAAQQLSASISEVARILENSDDVSTRAAQEAQGAGRSIDELETAAREIEDIMRLVADVAEQTNLLALNATIEAARAGEAGKGFAVVASEVKALAEQTTRASSDIASKIESMRGASGGAASALGRITEIISELRQSTESVQGAFSQQNAATREIAELAEKAAGATSDVTTSMNEVSGAAGRTNEAASKFALASAELGDSAQRLDTELNRFKQSLDAA